MTSSHEVPAKRIWPRSLLAVIAGMGIVIALSIATDTILVAVRVFPPPGEAYPSSLLVLALAYRTAFNMIGGYACGRFAPKHPAGHALALGVIGTAAALAGALFVKELGPAWYPWGLVALALPSTWAGALLVARR